MSKSMDFVVWNLLNQKSCLTFGQECGTVILWVVFSLTIRAILVLLRIDSYIANGFIFAFPLLMQSIVRFLPSIFHTVPLLPVRFAQSLVGKSNPMNILVLIPAHLLGAVIGLVCFRTVFPFLPNKMFEPITFESEESWGVNFILETLYNCIYVLVMLILPYLLQINRIHRFYLSLPLIPLFFCPCPTETAAFNPALVYGLWFIRNCSSLYINISTLQLDRIVGPLAGATIAAMICSVYFPDDSASWKRSPKCL